MFTELDRIAQINFAKKAGVAEGREDERITVAKAMIKENIPVETISKCTGLSPEIINNL